MRDLSERYFSAFFAWRPSESSRFSSSETMSATRRRFASVASIFRSAALRRALYFVTPAASSMMLRRSSGFDETMSPTRPCSMMQ